MGQCLFKAKPKKEPSRIYRKKHYIPSQKLFDEEVEVDCNQDENSYKKTKQINNNCDAGEKLSSRIEELNEKPATKVLEEQIEEDEQSIVLVNTDNNIVSELLMFHQQNNLDKEIEKIESLIDKYDTNVKNDYATPRKTECKYEQVFREGFNDDLELLNNCAKVKKPILYFYKESNTNKIEKQVALDTNILNDKFKQIPETEKKTKSTRNSENLKKVKKLDHTKAIETINYTSKYKNNKHNQNETGDWTKLESNEFELPMITTIGDVAPKNSLVTSSKSKGLEYSKSKTLKRKSRKYLAAILDKNDKDNIYNYPINANFMSNLNRNDSSNIAIDEDELRT